MRNLLILLTLITMLFTSLAYAEDYDTMYDNAQPFGTKLYNDIDPFEDEDAIKYAYSPYPLFRTSATLYFKDNTIEPGYYSLTPRKLKGKDYVLFKQGGKVKFIIPVVKKEATPVNFYQANTPQIKLTPTQKVAKAVRTKFYKMAHDSMKAEPPKSLVNVVVEIKYIVIQLFYGPDKYTIIFRRTPY